MYIVRPRKMLFVVEPDGKVINKNDFQYWIANLPRAGDFCTIDEAVEMIGWTSSLFYTPYGMGKNDHENALVFSDVCALTQLVGLSELVSYQSYATALSSARMQNKWSTEPPKKSSATSFKGGDEVASPQFVTADTLRPLSFSYAQAVKIDVACANLKQ